MYSYLRKTEKLQDTARDAMYRMYSKKEYMQLSHPELELKKALFEAAKKFFLRKKKTSPVKAFKEALTESVKPEWLLWAVNPTISQSEHNEIVAGSKIKPSAPPWSQR